MLMFNEYMFILQNKVTHENIMKVEDLWIQKGRVSTKMEV